MTTISPYHVTSAMYSIGFALIVFTALLDFSDKSGSKLQVISGVFSVALIVIAFVLFCVLSTHGAQG